jgi:hypothetical protein
MRLRRMSRALGLALAGSLTLLPAAAWAWGNDGFRTGVLTSRGQPFGAHPFVDHRFSHRRFRSDVVLINTVIVVRPFPHPVWVPAFWHWNGFAWVWVPGHGATAW